MKRTDTKCPAGAESQSISTRSPYHSKRPCGAADMLYEISDEDIQAIKNVEIIVNEMYDSRRVVEADDIIALRSINRLKQIVKAWEHDEQMWEQ